MAKKLKVADLSDSKLTPKGKSLVVELIEDHVQGSCTTVPKGTRAVAIWGLDGIILRIPLDALSEQSPWTDCHIRVMSKNATYTKTVGRVNLK